MTILSGEDEKQALAYIQNAVDLARNATCERSRCGSVIVFAGEEIIGKGWNTPPQNDERERRCTREKASYHPKVTDKTCCVHAEQRAIMDALRTHPTKLAGSRLYFIRLDSEGAPMRAGEPYCTICSKMALDVGIAEFVLWHEAGVCVYDTQEYNARSYAFGG
ncbi:hypothetical protein KBD13_03090 [Patescibacteria group bacterium]|nr:hypothetical protein [Patescibacteria group bacterium]MDQ5919370.1 CMP/dCMP-type deaminase protein [Patescibacteria group bacterium]